MLIEAKQSVSRLRLNTLKKTLNHPGDHVNEGVGQVEEGDPEAESQQPTNIGQQLNQRLKEMGDSFRVY